MRVPLAKDMKFLKTQYTYLHLLLYKKKNPKKYWDSFKN